MVRGGGGGEGEGVGWRVEERERGGVGWRPR